MNHNMQKVLFFEFVEMKQGDGLGPKFEAGKAYWLSTDQAERWKAEGVAEDAPKHIEAENEPALVLRPPNIRIVRAAHNRYDVLGPNDAKFNDAPLTPRNAELLRKRILEEGVPKAEAQEPALEAAQPGVTDFTISDGGPFPEEKSEAEPGVEDGEPGRW